MEYKTYKAPHKLWHALLSITLVLLFPINHAVSSELYFKLDIGPVITTIDKNKLNIADPSVDSEDYGIAAKLGAGLSINNHISLEIGTIQQSKNIDNIINKKHYISEGNYYSIAISNSINNTKYFFEVGKFNWNSLIKASSGFNEISIDGSDMYYGLGMLFKIRRTSSYAFNIEYYPLEYQSVKKVSLSYIINFGI